jgi:predicted  nucleic acid-binding Zn-ribbon protein
MTSSRLTYELLNDKIIQLESELESIKLEKTRIEGKLLDKEEENHKLKEQIHAETTKICLVKKQLEASEKMNRSMYHHF